MDKKALRAEMRARRRAFVEGLAPDERRALLDALVRNLLTLLPAEGVVASYSAIGDEIDPGGVRAALGDRLALPFFEHRAAPMSFRRAGGPLDDGPFGIPQPTADAAPVRPDALIVPLIAADGRRHRLGQGKGHYDRALAGLRGAPAIGVAWDVQIIDHVPDDPWDVPLDHVVTPTQVISAS
jgi:5-formyltetrahydrofolate cyclo-ligase